MDQAQPDPAHCVWLNAGQLGDFRQTQVRRLDKHRAYLRFKGGPVFVLLVRLPGADLADGLPSNAQPASKSGT